MIHDRSGGSGRPRLAVVFPHLDRGGGEIATIEVAAGLAERFAVRAVALDLRPPGPGPSIAAELALRLGGFERVGERWRLRGVLGAADAVLWYGVGTPVPRALAGLDAPERESRRPASVRVVHTERPEDGPAVAHRWGRVIDATVCVSPRIARRLPGAVFVPNPIPTSRLRGPRRDLFPGSPRPALGFLGRLLPLKNAGWLIDHLAELGCDLALQALDTELETAAGLAARAAGRGVGARVRFLPPGGDAGTLVRSVDALAVVSRHEGLPMAAIEAAAVGTPVIATRVGALAELFGDAVLFVDGAGGAPEGAGDTSDETPGGRQLGVEDAPEGAGGVPDVAALRRAVERVAGGREAGRGERLRALVEALCDPAAVAAGYARAIEGALDRVRSRRPSGRDAAVHGDRPPPTPTPEPGDGRAIEARSPVGERVARCATAPSQGDRGAARPAAGVRADPSWPA